MGYLLTEGMLWECSARLRCWGAGRAAPGAEGQRAHPFARLHLKHRVGHEEELLLPGHERLCARKFVDVLAAVVYLVLFLVTRVASWVEVNLPQHRRLLLVGLYITWTRTF